MTMADRRNRKKRMVRSDSRNRSGSRIPAAVAAAAEPAVERPGPQPWQSIRPDKLGKARRLVQDKKYPSKKVLESVAGLLADHLPAAK